MEFESHKMIVLPEKKRVVSASHHNNIPSENYDSSHTAGPSSSSSDRSRNEDDEQESAPEVPPKPEPPHYELTPDYSGLQSEQIGPQPDYTGLQTHHTGPQIDHEPDVGDDLDKDLFPETIQQKSIWKRRKWGRSIRFWSLLAVAVVLAAIVGGILGAHYRRKSRSNNFNFDESETPIPAPTLTLNCPTINQQVANFSGTRVPGAAVNTPMQFKQFCNKAVIAESNNMSQITLNEAENSNDVQYLDNPITVTSLHECIQSCATYNVDISLSSTTSLCFGAWFDANQTAESIAEGFVANNCYMYTMGKGNFTLDDLLVESGGRTAMAVMVSLNQDTFVGTYLSDNGDWVGGVNTTGNFL